MTERTAKENRKMTEIFDNPLFCDGRLAVVCDGKRIAEYAVSHGILAQASPMFRNQIERWRTPCLSVVVDDEKDVPALRAILRHVHDPPLAAVGLLNEAAQESGTRLCHVLGRASRVHRLADYMGVERLCHWVMTFVDTVTAHCREPTLDECLEVLSGLGQDTAADPKFLARVYTVVGGIVAERLSNAVLVGSEPELLNKFAALPFAVACDVIKSISADHENTVAALACVWLDHSYDAQGLTLEDARALINAVRLKAVDQCYLLHVLVRSRWFQECLSPGDWVQLGITTSDVFQVAASSNRSLCRCKITDASSLTRDLILASVIPAVRERLGKSESESESESGRGIGRRRAPKEDAHLYVDSPKQFLLHGFRANVVYRLEFQGMGATLCMGLRLSPPMATRAVSSCLSQDNLAPSSLTSLSVDSGDFHVRVCGGRPQVARVVSSMSAKDAEPVRGEESWYVEVLRLRHEADASRFAAIHTWNNRVLDRAGVLNVEIGWGRDDETDLTDEDMTDEDLTEDYLIDTDSVKSDASEGL